MLWASGLVVKALHRLGRDPGFNPQLVHITSHTLYQLMLLGQKIQALVDSGADSNFIIKRLVEALRILMVKGHKYKITFANRNVQYISEYVVIVLEFSPGYSMDIMATVIDILNHDLILGKPWLQKVNPMIDW